MPHLLAATLGKAVRAARLRAQLPQAQVAEALELPVAAYGRLERGLLLPNIQTLVQLSRLLRTPTDVLLGCEPQAPSKLPAPTR